MFDVEPSGYIPEPPLLPIEEIVLNALGEPTLQSLGLGSYFTIPGWLQLSLEAIHVNLDAPWYVSILIFSLIVRTLLLPISVKSQTQKANMQKSQFEITSAQDRLTEAKMSGNDTESNKIK